MDIDCVNLGGRRFGDSPCKRPRRDPLEELLTFGCRNGLRIAEPRNVPIGMQHDGACHYGAGEAPSAYFVDAADAVEPEFAQYVLERACCGNASHDEDPGDFISPLRASGQPCP